MQLACVVQEAVLLVSGWLTLRKVRPDHSGADARQLVTIARMTSAEILRQIRELAVTADRLTRTEATLADPTAVEAEVEAAQAAIQRRASWRQSGPSSVPLTPGGRQRPDIGGR
jgi:hypothetical protein